MVEIVAFDAIGEFAHIGSGFFIEPNKVLTCAHVMEDLHSAGLFLTRDPDKGDLQLKILKIDHDFDLALIEVDTPNDSYLTIGDISDVRPGKRIITIGSPLGFLSDTISDGLISAIRDEFGSLQIIQISAPISSGNSGGPLLSMNGHVIGVNYAGMSEGENLNFAIGIETIQRFLNRPNNPRQLPPAGSKVFGKAVLYRIGKIGGGIVRFIVSFMGPTFDASWFIFFMFLIVLGSVLYLGEALFKLLKKKLLKTQQRENSNFEINHFLRQIQISTLIITVAAFVFTLLSGFQENGIVVVSILLVFTFGLSLTRYIVGHKKE